MSAPRALSRRLAVLDVGSNSVRLVVYQCVGSAFWPIRNEKAVLGLGRTAGRLDPDAIDAAIGVIRRFRAIAKALETDAERAVATAAVRMAENGAAFVDAVADATGFRLEVCSGEDVARLAGLGVWAGVADADGLVGDLGGASLELTPVNNEGPGAGVSLPLGPLLFDAETDAPDADLDARIDAQLDRARDRIDAGSGRALYLVGGAWRGVARYAIRKSGRSFVQAHGWRWRVSEAQRIAADVIAAPLDALADYPGGSRRRARTLPFAAHTLARLLKSGAFSSVVVSAYGVREGVAAQFVADHAGAGRPGGLLAQARAFAEAQNARAPWGEAATALLEPVFGHAEAPARAGDLRSAAGLLSGLGEAFHPDHRAGLSFDMILAAPLGAVSPLERVFLAAAVYGRYARSAPPDAARDWLSAEDAARARQYGAGLRLAAALSGGAPELIRDSALEIVGGHLRLRVPPQAAAVEKLDKRLSQFAATLDLAPELVLDG
ncbi:MAG: hypothetical protein ACFB2Z_09885 [Maricaulaceae bacterium]